jgi:hypothetical protein
VTSEQIVKCREHTLGQLAAVGSLPARDPVLRAAVGRFRTLARRAIAHPTIEHFAEVERCRDWLRQVFTALAAEAAPLA